MSLTKGKSVWDRNNQLRERRVEHCVVIENSVLLQSTEVELVEVTYHYLWFCSENGRANDIRVESSFERESLS